ncbi:MAG: DUF4824 family protein [Gammaproteobacteria bacterium]|nr:DUF4824 family protein [Gammaproteobacteria bacterium]MCW8923665.1 DUF4824 family protein [Gammaproteobacteria bacterium]
MRKLILVGASVLLLTNVVVLAGVSYNRSGEPLVSIELTERELPVWQSYNSADENSGTALSLKWQVFNPDENLEYLSNTYITPSWLDDEKLTALGFDMDILKADIEKYQYRTWHHSVEALVVLEYQGDSYQRMLTVAENRMEILQKRAANFPDDKREQNKLSNFKKQLSRLKTSQSRLYAIDAGLDENALFQKYADKNRYLFVKAEIGLRWNKKDIEGRIRQLYVKQVHVPLPFSNMLSRISAGERYGAYNTTVVTPRYRVQLNIGQRLEPWVASVVATESADSSLK